MYVVVRRYRLAGSGGELAKRVRAEFLTLVRELPGFNSYYVVDCGGTEALSVSFWDSKPDAERCDQVARRWISKNAVGILPFPPDRLSGDVVIEMVGKHAPPDP